MTMHLFGTINTANAVAANNRGENEGTVSTLQKIIRNGDIYTTVSAEAIRYALREVWQIGSEEQLNRVVTHRGSTWKDPDFKCWQEHLDDDVLGYMNASEETQSRRGVLELTRAISTTPWAGTLSSNFASPGSNPGLRNEDPIPYQVEVHDTRYQYSFAMTPDSLSKDKATRTAMTLRAIQNLRRVAGNHARFLFDFSPEVIVLRWTQDPAPRMLLCFDEDENGRLSLGRLVRRLRGNYSGWELRLISSMKEKGDVPREGKSLVIAADLEGVLHFRVFDGAGKTVVDTDEKGLTVHSRQLGVLKKRLKSLWPPQVLPEKEKTQIIEAITSIVGYTHDSDIDPTELVVGSVVPTVRGVGSLRRLNVPVFRGIRSAVSEILRRIDQNLKQA